MKRSWTVAAGALALVGVFVGVVAIPRKSLRRESAVVPEQMRIGLEQADVFELLSIHPGYSINARDSGSGDGGTEAAKERARSLFHNHEILGGTSITDASIRRRLVEALEAGVRESDGNEASCFNPRHGVRVTRAGKRIDFLICFECLQIEVFTDEGDYGTILTSASPATIFNQALRDAGLPLAPGPDE